MLDKNRTDSYTSDGSITKPFKIIQNAINASSGDTLIKIAPGTYTENIIMKAGVILEGIRGAVTITSSSGDTILISGISSVTLKDLTIQNTDPTMKAGIKFVNASGASNKIYNCSITSLGRSIDALNTTGIHGFTVYLYGTLYLDTVTSVSFTNHGYVMETSGLEPLLQIKNSSDVVFSNTFYILANNAKAIVVDNSSSRIMNSPQVIISSDNNDSIELKNTSALTLQGGGLLSGAGKKDLIIDATSYVIIKDVYYDRTKLQLANPAINIQKLDFAWQQVYDPAGTGLTSKDVQGAITELDTNKSETSHNHNLADLTEKSYNSLSDKPNVIKTVTFNLPATTIANGEKIQLHRWTLGSGEVLKVWAVGLSSDSGNQVANAKVQIYNETDVQEEYSSNSTFLTGTPITTLSLAGKDVSIKIKNDSGLAGDFHGFITISVE